MRAAAIVCLALAPCFVGTAGCGVSHHERALRGLPAHAPSPTVCEAADAEALSCEEGEAASDDGDVGSPEACAFLSTSEALLAADEDRTADGDRTVHPGRRRHLVLHVLRC